MLWSVQLNSSSDLSESVLNLTKSRFQTELRLHVSNFPSLKLFKNPTVIPQNHPAPAPEISSYSTELWGPSVLAFICQNIHAYEYFLQSVYITIYFILHHSVLANEMYKSFIKRYEVFNIYFFYFIYIYLFLQITMVTEQCAGWFWHISNWHKIHITGLKRVYEKGDWRE